LLLKSFVIIPVTGHIAYGSAALLRVALIKPLHHELLTLVLLIQ